MSEFDKWKEYYSTWDTGELLEELRDVRETVSKIQSKPMREEAGVAGGIHAVPNVKLVALQEVLKERGMR